MNKIAPALLVAFATLLPAAASATDLCNVPQDQWMPEAQIRARAAELGYDVRQVKVEDGCYEIYAIDSNGSKIEAYLHPATAAVVKVKDKS
ncbi:MAG: PepSY domain-containing protein [Rhizobiaceae bacterium]